MRFSFSLLALVPLGALSTSVVTPDAAALAATLTAANHYGAPIPPWEAGSVPGWYYGDNPDNILVEALTWLEDELICLILDLLPLCLHCPKPGSGSGSGGYTTVFTNYTGAVQGSDYLTYGLVDTVADCQTMCDSTTGCVFFNTYHDVNGKNGSPLLTCSLFTKCHTKADADNFGGQTQPDGTVDFITDSAGYCKK